jgi:hypothetical protein
VRRTHHDTFENGLAANQRFFATFKGGEKLDSNQKTYEIS